MICVILENELRWVPTFRPTFDREDRGLARRVQRKLTYSMFSRKIPLNYSHLIILLKERF
tara:strand:- start:303 stop:482 length:180 start_codon:yes stop_codon:yes gene_type:complete